MIVACKECFKAFDDSEAHKQCPHCAAHNFPEFMPVHKSLINPMFKTYSKGFYSGEFGVAIFDDLYKELEKLDNFKRGLSAEAYIQFTVDSIQALEKIEKESNVFEDENNFELITLLRVLTLYLNAFHDACYAGNQKLRAEFSAREATIHLKSSARFEEQANKFLSEIEDVKAHLAKANEERANAKA